MPVGGETWWVVRDPRELEAWSAAIDSLVARRRLPTLSGAAWMSSLWEGFFPGDQSVAVHLLASGGAVLAALPVRREPGFARKLVSLQNPHVPCWVPALDDRHPRLAALLLDRMLAACDCLELRRLPLDGPLARALRLEASFRDLPVSEHERPRGEVSLSLFGPWPAFEATLSRHLRRDARRLDALGALGRVELELVEGGPALGPALDACFALEARAGRRMSAAPILTEPGARLFYKLLAARAAARKQLALFLLRLEGRVIAFEYGVRSEGRIDCLKTGHDGALADHAPGTILRMMILQRSIERGEATSYHLGQASRGKARWASEVERIGTLRVFADSARARLAHLAIPALRATARRLPGARRTVGLLRRGLALARAAVRRRD
jgi:CelD/BcsL family acetyltransferase involved in cellulose biosynthesis